MNIFIIGKPNCGKSTLAGELIETAKQKRLSYCGILTPEIRKNNSRTGFKIIALPDEEERILASIELSYPRVSKYGVNIKGIDETVDTVRKNMGKVKIVFIDEIGKMEMLSEKFKEFLFEVLKSDKKVIATLNLALLKEFKEYGKVFWLTRNNYKEIKQSLLKLLL